METSPITQSILSTAPPEASGRLVASAGREVDQILAATVESAVSGTLGTQVDVRV